MADKVKLDRAAIRALVRDLQQPVRRPLSRAEIRALVRGLDPVDLVQWRLTLQLTPEERMLAGLRAARFARAIVRGVLHERYPHLSLSELNMKVLEHFTPVRIAKR